MTFTLTCCQKRGARLTFGDHRDRPDTQTRTAMGEERPWPWERSYPPGVRWDAPLAISTLPQMLDAFTVQWGPKPALEYRDRTISYAELHAAVDASPAGLLDLGVAPGHGRRALSAQHPLPPHRLLRGAPMRRPRRAPLAARCRAGAGLQAQGQRRPHPGDDQHRLHGPDGAEAHGRRPRRPADRRRRHGLRSLGASRQRLFPTTPTSSASTRCAKPAPASCRGNGRRSRSRTSRCCSTPAAPPAGPRAPS